MIHELVDVKSFGCKGFCILYTTTDEDVTYTGGVISLDKKWILPCTMGKIQSIWISMYVAEAKDGSMGYFINKLNGKPSQVSEALIHLVDGVLFEREILK